MKNNKVKAVVVAGYMSAGRTPEMIFLIGAYENIEEAYGAAYLYLADMADGHKDDYNGKITSLFKLEGDAGFGMYLESRDGKPEDYAYILFNDNYEEAEHENAERKSN